MAPTPRKFRVCLALGSSLFFFFFGAAAFPAAEAQLAGRPLREVLSGIQSSGLRLIFSSQTVTDEMRVESEPTAADVEGRLREMLRPHSLTLMPLSGGWVVVPIEDSQELQLHVTVRDKRTHALISQASVTLGDGANSLTTGASGETVFKGLLPRRYALQVQAAAYEPATQSVRVRAHGTSEVVIELAAQGSSLNEIVVETSRFALSNEHAAGPTALSRGEISNIVGTDEDVVRSLHNLPGNSSSGISAKLHVRGARDDETLFRFDGVDLIDPFHLKDFQSLFSALDPAVVDEVTFWSGDFPVDYGASIGGVLDIQPRKITAPTAEAGVSLIDNSVFAGSPFANDRGSLFLNARVSNLTRVTRLLDHDIGEPEFGDLTLRGTWEATPATSLVVGALAIEDDLALKSESPAQKARATYRDRYAWFKAHHEWSDRVASDTTLSNAWLRASRNASVDRPGVNRGVLSELKHSTTTQLRHEMTIDATHFMSIRLGAEASYADTLDSFQSSAEYFSPFVPAVQNSTGGMINSTVPANFSTRNAYAATRWRLGPESVLELGLRRDAQSFKSEGEHSQWNIRANLLQRVGSTSLRLGWGQYSQPQAINDLDVGDGFNDLYRSRRMTQVTASAESQLTNGWTLRIAGYLKREEFPFLAQENLFSFLTLAPEIEVDRTGILSQGGHMRGVELSLSSDPRRSWSGSVTYTHARAFDRIAKTDVPRSWDQPNALQAQLRWHWRQWDASAQFDWHTGWPYTPLLLADDDTKVVGLGSRNSAREESYRSVDLRAIWTQPLRIGSLELSFELRNALNFDNICCREYLVEDSGMIASKRRDFLPLTPIAGVRWRW